jgi:hypothetical protein
LWNEFIGKIKIINKLQEIYWINLYLCGISALIITIMKLNSTSMGISTIILIAINEFLGGFGIYLLKQQIDKLINNWNTL